MDDLSKDLPYPPIWGIYRGIVAAVNDPEHLGRIQILIPALLGLSAVSPWATPCSPVGQLLVHPRVGEGVWVAFEGGDIEKPIWIGVWPIPSQIVRTTLGLSLGVRASTPTIS